MDRLCKAHINCAALQHNLNSIKHYAPQSKIIAVLKADAYGHGLVSIANQLSQIDAIGVARIEEAMQLRQAGNSQRTLLMEGILYADEIELVQQYGFDIVVHHEQQIAMLEQQQAKLDGIVWIKVDTGMHRLGFMPEQLPTVYQRLQSCLTSKGQIALQTHFAQSEQNDDVCTAKQIEIFSACHRQMDVATSLANSAAIMAWPDSHGDWVRPGAMLYGISPFADSVAQDHQLKPVMTLTAKLITIRHVKQGECIGYGGKWQCPQDSRIGIVAIGYGDGYPREIAAGTPVFLNDKRSSIVGAVSMDMITIDLSEHPDAVLGDDVVLWGPQLPIETIAQHADTDPRALVSGLTDRVARCYS